MAAKQWSSPPAMQIDPAKTYKVTMETNKGTIELELYPAHAPQTVNNFVFLARDGYYDGVLFHRVIENFMIQGGDPTGTGRGGPGYRFRDELEGDGRYEQGVVAMANAGPNTNGSQFFICHTDVSLPHSYTIFGKVSSGQEVVDSIATTPTDSSDRPREDAVINSISITES